ncbi:MAG TPA: hypothetical protein VNS22_16490 [Geminicoccus sp.]|uniref:DUF2272 domain-containing protein n=1 Tax=Geminicoccus sp. TaxID=2024832 RepID=UPI002C7806E4|nr:hypothetical protein [Geminicoccus sp.]HWL69971.1 hypothetical protein [Geminicoccus sp.]
MLRYVDVETLNLCAQPAVAPWSRLSILHLGQPVELLGQADAPGWVRVVVRAGGRDLAGVVPAEQEGRSTLRQPVTAGREALIAQAVREWLRFAQGLGKADRAPFAGHVEEMWQSLGEGRAGGPGWSAAALSFMVRNAAVIIPAYHRFAFSGRHHDYGRDAFAKRRQGEAGAPFWGYRAGERAFAIGDVVLTRCGWPDGGEGTALTDEPSAIAQVLVSVRPDHVLAIGGDVCSSVRLSRLGKIEPGSLTGDGSVILHLSNRADEAG